MATRRGRPPHPEPVTPAEARVLELVRGGMPNAEIAVRLGLSVNTVKYHVSNLLTKAGVSERAELGAARLDLKPRTRRLRAFLPALPLWLKLVGGAAAVVTAIGVGAALLLWPPGESHAAPLFGPNGEPLCSLTSFGVSAFAGPGPLSVSVAHRGGPCYLWGNLTFEITSSDLAAALRPDLDAPLGGYFNDGTNEPDEHVGLYAWGAWCGAAPEVRWTLRSSAEPAPVRGTIPLVTTPPCSDGPTDSALRLTTYGFISYGPEGSHGSPNLKPTSSFVPGSDPPECSGGVSALAVQIVQAADAAQVVVAFSNDHAECRQTGQMTVDVTDGAAGWQHNATGAAPIDIVVGTDPLTETLVWRNWCGGPNPSVTVRFAGTTKTVQTETVPACVNSRGIPAVESITGGF